MNEGDFIITPPWAWHDHGNKSDQPIFWLDGLDIPVVQFLDASFAEHLDQDEQPIYRPVGDSDARYGANLLPVDHKPGGGSSPVFNYPYARTRDALERLRRAEAWDPCHGLKMRYTNPITGNHAMATTGTFVQLLPKVRGGSIERGNVWMSSSNEAGETETTQSRIETARSNRSRKR
jgi:gentisate 1,2-dioxygenase